MTVDLFDFQQEKIQIADGAYWLKGFALAVADDLCSVLRQYIAVSPPKKMMTPMGYNMTVQTTSMGELGWVSSKAGYGYASRNPVDGKPWPAMPKAFLALATRAANEAGYQRFVPDCCLVNIYDVGSKMGLHQDKDERDFSQPVVSVSLGLPATFLMGGDKRSGRTVKVPVNHGDVVVFGGVSRLFFHGVQPIKAGSHPLINNQRINLTFRKAGSEHFIQ